MLSVDSVDLAFNDRQIISGCYLSVNKGEIVGLLGRNGCGKSSLLKIMFGVLNAKYHHLRIDDKVIAGKGFLTKEIVYLPQEDFLPKFLRVKELLYPIKRFEFDDFIYKLSEKKLNELSGGELKIIECLWIFSLNSSYVLLDEPFKGLSPISIEKVQDLIQKSKRNKGIIITDHTYQPLLNIADRIVLMHNNSVYNIHSLDDLIFYKYLPG